MTDHFSHSQSGQTQSGQTQSGQTQSGQTQSGPGSPPGPDRPGSVATVSDTLAVLDVLASTGDADPGSLLLLLAGPGGRVATVVGIDEVPPDPPQHERVAVLAPFLRSLADRLDGIAGVALAVCRNGTLEVEGGDLAWHDAFSGAVRVAGFADHGTYLVTPRGGRPVLPRSRRWFG